MKPTGAWLKTDRLLAEGRILTDGNGYKETQLQSSRHAAPGPIRQPSRITHVQVLGHLLHPQPLMLCPTPSVPGCL